MRANLQALPLVFALAGLGNAQCLSVPSVSMLSGVTYRVWTPVTPAGTPCGSGDLVIYAHGYVTPRAPADAWTHELMVGGLSLPAVLNQAGFVFVGSDYSKTGLAVVEGVQNTLALANAARNAGIPGLRVPPHIYLIGASEGGLVSTLSAEQDTGVYNSAGAACGPIGNFQSQLNYLNDFRVVFDYLFPQVIPGSPVSIADTEAAAAQWGTLSTVQIPQALSDTAKTQQLFRVMGINMPSDPGAVLTTVMDVLRYNVFGTADAQQELGGQPYDNTSRIYAGSANDILLNLNIKRYKADPAALAAVAAKYQTSGKLKLPLITMHTLSDPIVPYWHEPLYTAKTLYAGTLVDRINLPVSAYGHCHFSSTEILAAFALLVLRSTGSDITSILRSVLPEADQPEFNATLWRNAAAQK